MTSAEGRADLPLESMRRLTCDGSVIPIMDGPNGEPLGVGRKQRRVSAAIKRALWARDKACSFPGCTHKRFIDVHHVVHWSQGGETSVDIIGAVGTSGGPTAAPCLRTATNPQT